MTVLTLIQRATNLLSINMPSYVFGNPDEQVRQLQALANQEGRLLAHSHFWQSLDRVQIFTTVNDEEQDAGLPDDWDRFIDGTWFNRTTRRPLYGPLSQQEWQYLEAQPAYASPYLNFRLRDDTFWILPVPPAGQIIAYEYITKNWVKAPLMDAPTRFSTQDEFTADNQTTYLDERLISYGIVWRFLQAKGLDYAEAMATYGAELERLQGAEKGARVLTLDGRGRFAIPAGPNLPDGNWSL